jgi:hypothetical protein
MSGGNERGKTYALSGAGADIVRQTRDVSGAAHENGSLDHVERAGRDARCGRGDARTGVGAAADGVVHDLSALGVSDKDNLGVWTALVEAVHGGGHGSRALGGRSAILDAAARRLSAASRVADGLGRGTGEGTEDEVDDLASGAEAGGDGCLTGAEDVDGWA